MMTPSLESNEFIRSQLEAYESDPLVLPARRADAEIIPPSEWAKYKRSLTLATAESYVELIVERALRDNPRSVEEFADRGFMISRIFLFGSTLRKDPRPNDVDLAMSVFTLYDNFFHYYAEGERGHKKRTYLRKQITAGTRQVHLLGVDQLTMPGCQYKLLYAHPVYGGGVEFSTSILRRKS